MAGRTGKKAATRKGPIDDPINSDGEEKSDDDSSSEDEYRTYCKGKGDDVEYNSSEEESSVSEEEVEEVTKKPSKKRGPTKKKKKNDKKRKKQAPKDLMITPRTMSTKKARPTPLAARVSTGGDGFETPNGESFAIESTGANNAAALMADNAALRRQMEQMHQYMAFRGGKGKSVTRKLRREGLGSTDHLNIKELYTYIMDQVWRYFKMMPKGWNKYRIEPLSTCAQMLAKVTVPNGMQPEFYWNNVIVVFANDKLCATRANFKMNLLKRYKSMCVNYSSLLL